VESILASDAEGCDLINQIDVTNIHPSAAISLEADVVKDFLRVLASIYCGLELVIQVRYDLAAAPTTNWYQHLESPIRLLPLLASASAHLVLRLLASWVINQQAAVKSEVLISEFLINSLSAAVVVYETASDCGSNRIDLSHLTAALNIDDDVDVGEAVHRLGDLNWL
tara:strand:+ start:82 stop:585 length:504 start_codon:yes stop_codon:yes gene_type:complete